uniref:Uncharacterized protein n=1 Tax=Zea mays TaxID=4577 RepID=A0A804QRY7_MAIZE
DDDTTSLDELPEVRPYYVAVNQEVVVADERRRRPVEQQRRRRVHQGPAAAVDKRLRLRLRLRLVLVLVGVRVEVRLLLAAQLQHLAVGVGVLGHHERRARRRAVLRHQASRLVPHAARVAQSLGAQRPRPPLGRLVGLAVQAPPRLPRAGAVVGHRRRRRLLLLRGLRRLLGRERHRRRGAGLGRRDGRGRRRRRGRREHQQAGGPAAWRDARPLAARLAWHWRLRWQRAVGWRLCLRGGRGSRGGGGRRNAVDKPQLLQVLRGEVVLAHIVGQPFQLNELVVLRGDSSEQEKPVSNDAVKVC